jgi:hypothetical protein
MRLEDPNVDRRVAATLLVIVLMVGGCAQAVRETWSKTGATRQEVSRDALDCEREATVDPTHGQEQGAYGAGGPRKSESAFAACMRARGYALVTRG